MGWAEHQLPNGDEIFLDHVAYFVADLDGAAQSLERLGFQVSPINVHYNPDEHGDLVPAGTSNRLVLFERGFVEVLAASHDTPLANQLREALDRYQGLHLIALTHPDMASQRERLVQAGFAMQQVVELRRRVETPEGERLMAYSVLRTKPGEMPEGRVQMLTNHTPELLWTGRATVHQNRVEALTSLLICVEDPRSAALRYGRFTGRAADGGNSFHSIPLDRGRILLVGPGDAVRIIPGLIPPDLPYIAGVALRCADIGAAQRVLTRKGIRPVATSSELVCVGPADALGAHLLFHAASLDNPWQSLADGPHRRAGGEPSGA